MKEKFPDAEIITDIGSGINFKRKGLKAILESAIKGDCITLYITHKDRLCRFGYDLIEWIITRAGGQILVQNEKSQKRSDIRIKKTMHYEGNIIRPPSEANSILLQVTVGCSHNKCTFCGAYKGERFTIKSDSVIFEDIDFAATYCKRQTRLFICDGDALVIPQKRLVPILERINKSLPWIERIGLYANTKSIKMKTSDELKELRELGVKIAYMGLETGDDITLKIINKGADSIKMVEMGKKIRKAGIQLSITVLLGLAGRERSHIHATETGRVLSAIDPEYVGALSLMLIPGTPMHTDYQNGKFELITPDEMLTELGTMIATTHLTDGLFHANHASNYLPIRANLPREREKTLALIAKAIDGKVRLRPEYMRAL